MADKPYSKREQDERSDDVRERLDAILAQTQKTNGRVSKLEDKAIESRTRITMIIWFGTVFIAPVFIGLVLYFLTNHHL